MPAVRGRVNVRAKRRRQEIVRRLRWVEVSGAPYPVPLFPSGGSPARRYQVTKKGVPGMAHPLYYSVQNYLFYISGYNNQEIITNQVGDTQEYKACSLSSCLYPPVSPLLPFRY